MSFPEIRSIGKNAAEEDAVLDYFLTTDAVQKISTNETFLILGRKGAGKTALVTHFTTGSRSQYSKALNLRNYPWKLHSELKNSQTTEIEAYVASWGYLIASQAASVLLAIKRDNEIDAEKKLREFFERNYGAPSVDVDKVFSPDRIEFQSGKLDPKLAGASIGSIEFKKIESSFGQQIEAVTNEIHRLIEEILKYRTNKVQIELHFDELDFGIEKFERNRELMIVGLVLAVAALRARVDASGQLVRPFVYLRYDLWQTFNFSDKNKIARGPTLPLTWNSESLLDMVNTRIKKITNNKYQWSDLIDSRLMRGTQQKWDNLIARTLDRPRDVISFINFVLERKKCKDLLNNEDISNARSEYSNYFKEELDDEIKAHWPQWEESINALRDIGYVTFLKSQFEEEYNKRLSEKNQIKDANTALEKLFEYSVVGYKRPKSGGGSGWIYQYKDRTATFDARAESFKVHLGLSEFANLREERRA